MIDDATKRCSHSPDVYTICLECADAAVKAAEERGRIDRVRMNATELDGLFKRSDKAAAVMRERAENRVDDCELDIKGFWPENQKVVEQIADTVKQAIKQAIRALPLHKESDDRGGE